MHGGDTYGLGAVVDVSANVNPLGMPPAMVEALQQAVTTCAVYPDPQCRDLRQAIAQRDGVRPAQVVCGNGAADVIFRLCQAIAPQKALLTAPTFGEYGQGLHSVGCEILRHTLDPECDFGVEMDMVKALTPEMDMVFLCTPNNPTGQRVAPAVVEAMAKRCQELDCYLVVDECFLDLCQSPYPFTYLLENPYVVLLRAFTKSYAMAGLRLGYCLTGNVALCEKLMAVAQPWSVSTLAQVAGMVACDCLTWTAQARALVKEERPKLVEALEACGCQVWPGEANFLLFRKAGQMDLKEQLLTKGVLIRSCANYPGLGAEYYRIAIAKPADNQRFITALRAVLED